jgi:hypothetical protein
MSAIGTKRTCRPRLVMSATVLEADIEVRSDAPLMQHKRDMTKKICNEFKAGSQIPNLEAAGSNPAGVTNLDKRDSGIG